MLEMKYVKKIRIEVNYLRTNRHQTHIFDLILKAEGSKGYALAKIHLNKQNEIKIDFDARNTFGVLEETKSLGIFKEDLTKTLSAQIRVEQLTELIK